MTTYRDILDSEIAVGSGLTQTTMQSLKDNIDTVFQGGDLAPQILPAALARATGSGTSAANNIIMQLFEVFTVDNASLLGFKVRVAGTYRVNLEVRLADSPAQSASGALQQNEVVAKIQKNGSDEHTLSRSVDTTNANNDTFTEITHDMTLAVDDHINIHVDVTSARGDGGNMILTVCVDDHDAMYGVNVYGVL